MTRAAENLVTAMPGAGVTRLISMTGAGVAQPGDQPRVLDRVIRTALCLRQSDVLRDSEGHVARLRASDLGRHLLPVWSVVGLHRPAEINRSHVPAFLAGEPARR